MKLVNWSIGDQAGFGGVTEGGPADGYAISARDFNPAFKSTDDVLRAGRFTSFGSGGPAAGPPSRSPGGRSRR
jgi:hypothetical protein